MRINQDRRSQRLRSTKGNTMTCTKMQTISTSIQEHSMQAHMMTMKVV